MTEYEQALQEKGIALSRKSFMVGYDEFEYIANNLASIGPEGPRRTLCKKFSFAIPDARTLELVAGYGPILELGSGTGYWAYELKKLGVDIIATDPNPPGKNDYDFGPTWCEVKKLNQSAAIKKYGTGRSLLMIWPCMAGWAAYALSKFKGQHVLYIGEGSGGCTGDDKFHSILYKRWEELAEVNIPVWTGCHDRLFIFKRK